MTSAARRVRREALQAMYLMTLPLLTLPAILLLPLQLMLTRSMAVVLNKMDLLQMVLRCRRIVLMMGPSR